MNTPLPYKHIQDLSERQLLQVIVDKLCCVAGKYILDIYGGAAAAYSLRSLSKDTIDVVRVRRSSDNAEADFNPTEITDGTLESWVNAGEVFTNPNITGATGWTLGANTTYNATTEAFDLLNENGLTVRQSESINGHTYAITIVLDSVTSAGVKIYAGGTQSAVISSAGTYTLNIVGGSSNDFLGINPNGAATCSISSFSAIDITADGYVTTWYDQSGNSNSATQATAASQPKIVDAGVLVEENGKPSIDFASNKSLFESSVSLTQPFTRFSVRRYTDETTSKDVFLGQNIGSFSNLLDISFITLKSHFGSYLAGDAETFTNNISYLLANGANSETKENNSTLYTNDNGTNGLSGLRIGFSSSTTFFRSNVKGQEIIIWDSDQSANRTGIETNINDHYNIYP